jgi:hypothetical protein
LSSLAAAAADRQAACNTVGSIGLSADRPGNRNDDGVRQPVVAAQDAEQGLGEHHVALLAALPVLDPHHHAAAIDVADLERGNFGDP